MQNSGHIIPLPIRIKQKEEEKKSWMEKEGNERKKKSEIATQATKTKKNKFQRTECTLNLCSFLYDFLTQLSNQIQFN